MIFRIAKPTLVPAPIANEFGLSTSRKTHNFPYIVDVRSQAPHYDSLGFLAAYAEFNVSEKTRQTRCEQLIDWLRFKDSYLLQNVRVDRQLHQYRMDLEGRISSRTLRPLARSTQLGRLDLAAHYERWIGTPEPRPDPFSLPVYKGPRRRSQPRQKVSPFSQDEMVRFLSHLRKGSSHCGAAARRNWLIATMGFVTGARLDEILSVEHRDIAVWKSDDEGTTLVLTRSKGRRTNYTGRTIFIPPALKLGLIQYCLTERPKIVDSARRTVPGYREPRQLFLNSTGANRKSVGRPFQQRRACEFFNRVQIACGITRRQVIFNSVSGISEEHIAAKHTFHHTRHTYVVMAYRYYRSVGLTSDQTWRAIADNLGHRHVSTTIEIYGASITSDEVRLRDSQFTVMERILQGGL